MEETISLKELMQTLRKRLALIIIITITAALVSGIVSYYYLTPTYQASTLLLINQSKDGDTTLNEIQTDLQLINTYSVVITSSKNLDPVIKKLDLNMTASQLKGKITVQNDKSAQTLIISVQDTNANLAAKIANKVAEVFAEEKIMNIDNVKILDRADVPTSPINPNPKLNVAIALVVGLMASVGLAFLLEYLDNTIKTEQDIENILGIPVLGVIAVMGEEKQKRTLFRKNEKSGENVEF